MRTSTTIFVGTVGLIASAIAGVLFADEAKQSATITYRQEEFGSLADALDIKTKRGTVELSQPVKEAWAEIEFYKDGKKLARQLSTQPLGRTLNGAAVTSKSVQFAIHVIDLDKLKLGGPAGNSRWILQVGDTGADGWSMTAQADVPNTYFGPPNFGTYTLRGTVGNRIFLCWALGRTSDKIYKGADTPEELLANNPHAELAIVYLNWK